MRSLDDFIARAELIPKQEEKESFPYWDYVWDNLSEAELFVNANRGYIHGYTLIETDDDRQWIVEGISHLNRLGYLFARKYIPLREPILFFDRTEA